MRSQTEWSNIAHQRHCCWLQLRS